VLGILVRQPVVDATLAVGAIPANLAARAFGIGIFSDELA